MLKKRSLLFQLSATGLALLLAGGLLLQSCGEKIEPEITPVENSETGQVKSFTLSVVASKAAIDTKALDLSNGNLSATWKAGDRVSVSNKTQNSALKGYLEAQEDGVSTTLKGTLDGTIGVSDTLTLEFLDSNYSEQDGTLAYIAAHCDYATAEVVVKSVADGLVTTQAAAQFTGQQAIVAFQLQESDGAALAGGVSKLTVVAGETTINVVPGAATDVLYVAIPAIRNGGLRLSALDPNGTPRSYAEAEATFEKGGYYKRDVKMDCIVTNADELFAANTSQVPKIVLGADLQLTGPDPITISGAPTVDLNGHSISGNNSHRIFTVPSDQSLTLNGPGTLKEGHADEGGAVYNRGTLVLQDVTFTDCRATAGGAIYNEGTLRMSGTIVAYNNTGADDVPDNVYLANGSVITVKGAFTEGTLIGVTRAGGAGSITAGYSSFNGTTDPALVFIPDDAGCHLTWNNGEAHLAMGRYYTVTAEKAYASQQALLEETGRDLSSADFLLSILFPDRNIPAHAISYTYRSVDPQGYPVELSAIVYIPDTALDGSRSLTGICLANHGTIASNAECPTRQAQFEGAFAWKNYAIVMPDYYGFGVSANRPQAYLDPETTARGNIDAYLAAVQLLQDRKVRIPGKLFSFGYSQGGFNSMANLKYVSQHPELHVTFEKVMCGGSPFDVELTWEAYTQGTFRNAIAFVPLTLVSMNESQRLGLNYADLFKGSLLDHWQDWILSKQYSLSSINTKLGTNDLSVIMNDGFMTRTGDAYDAIMQVCRRYSLTSGWVPPSDTKIILYHSRQDDTVPYANLTAMKAFLDQVAPGRYTLYEGDDGGHVNAVIRFVRYIIPAW